MIRCVIVDDEPIGRKTLAEHADNIRDLEIIASLPNAVDLSDFLKKEDVDLILLDIHMPKLSGIDFMKIQKDPPLVIFTTAYAEYAVEAFSVHAVDYLMKPISLDRFIKAIDRAREIMSKGNGANWMIVKEGSRIYRIATGDIFYVQAYGDYVKIFTAEKTYLSKDRLTNLTATLPDPFIQVHRSYIVNLNYLQYVEGNQVTIKGTKIPVSNSFRNDLLARL